MVRFRVKALVLGVATLLGGIQSVRAAPAAPTAPGGLEEEATVSAAPGAQRQEAAFRGRSRGRRLVSPVMAPFAIPPGAGVPTPTAPSMMLAPVPPGADASSGGAETRSEARVEEKMDGATVAATAARADAEDAVAQSSEQLDKFHQLYEDATKIFGKEHTVISPSFFVATDIKGRLNATLKHETGLSATLMLPLVGAGGGHDVDWWPVLASSDETRIYQAFLAQLAQFQQAEANMKQLTGNIDIVAHTKWNVQNLLLAKQLFCQENVDPDLPQQARDAIDKLCADPRFTTMTSLDPTPEQQIVIDAVSQGNRSGVIELKRHNFLIGPSLGIPLTKNPTDIFELGLSAEMGNDNFRMMATGGLVGRYQGATYRDIFAAGWFVGLALSGQIGDDVFHYFNGGSNLMSQLAKIKNDPGS